MNIEEMKNKIIKFHELKKQSPQPREVEYVIVEKNDK